MKKILFLFLFIIFSNAYSSEIDQDYECLLLPHEIDEMEIFPEKKKKESTNEIIKKHTEIIDNLKLTVDDDSYKDDEIKKLKKELEYNKGFLKSVENKLNNEKFVKNAPSQVVNNEKNKMIDIKSKIQIITNKISSFQNP